VIDNISWIRGRHALKAGVDAQWVADRRTRGEQFVYEFPNTAAYLAAKNGTAPFGYSTLQQLFGNRDAEYSSGFYGLFAQDDWQVTPQLKVLYGIRYDVFDVPSARPFAANPYSQSFTVDKNNFGPRVGLSWSVDSSARTVVRASSGLMYEPPLLDFYDNAILSNGDPASFTVSLSGTSAGAPAFPGSLANVPAGFVLPRQSITAVDPDFKTQSAWLSNIQFERALNNDISVAVGYVNSIGRNLPVLMNVNLIPTAGRLPDGRPIYSTAVSAATRVDPTFNQINMFKSIGEAVYNAFTATATKRMTNGWMATATYTLARGEDSAPLTGTYVVGSADDRVSDPSDLDRDRGVTPFNQLHTFSFSTVIAPQVASTRPGAFLWNHNQLGIILQANSGLPFNIRAAADLNGDGILNDRPNGIERNAGRLGRVVNLDLRYSRFIPTRNGQRAELFLEAKNMFNTENIAGVNRVVATDAQGNPASPILFNGRDYPTAGKSGYDQRLIQLGVKYSF
jgi:hypothetical protein